MSQSSFLTVWTSNAYRLPAHRINYLLFCYDGHYDCRSANRGDLDSLPGFSQLNSSPACDLSGATARFPDKTPSTKGTFRATTRASRWGTIECWCHVIIKTAAYLKTGREYCYLRLSTAPCSGLTCRWWLQCWQLSYVQRLDSFLAYFPGCSASLTQSSAGTADPCFSYVAYCLNGGFAAMVAYWLLPGSIADLAMSFIASSLRVHGRIFFTYHPNQCLLNLAHFGRSCWL